MLANNRTSEILYLLSSYRSFSSWSGGWGGLIADLEAEADYFPVECCSSMRRKCRTVYWLYRLFVGLREHETSWLLYLKYSDVQ